MSGEQDRSRSFGAREIYESPELWLGQIDVELPGGERVWQHVVRLPQVALLALVDEDRQVLLVRRHRLVLDRWGWELPGGLVDDEEDAGQAALRELEDMTGYRAGRVQELIRFWPLAETVDCEHVAFVGHDPERAGEAVASDVKRAEWVPLGSVLGLIADSQIWNAGTLVALMRLLTVDGPAVSH